MNQTVASSRSTTSIVARPRRNQLRSAKVRLLVTLLTWLVLSANAWTPLTAQDGINGGKDALSRKQYPWYDAATDAPKRVELQQRAEARSKNRENIPVHQPNPANLPNQGGMGLRSGFFDGLGVIAWVGLGVLIAVLIGVLIWAFLRMESNQEQDDELVPRRSMEESIKQLPFDLDATNGDFRQLAQAAYNRGDFRQAIIFLFSHVLVSLDQKGLVRLRKGKTNRQYLRELQRHRSLAQYYQGVMVPFEATFFGGHELERNEFENCWNQLDQFQHGIENSSQVANV